MLAASIKRLPLVRSLLEFRNAGRPLPSWEAAAAAGSYEDELVNRFRVDREALRPRQQPPGLLGDLVKKFGARHVVDFGGGPGDLARDLIEASPGVAVTIVENPTMVRLARRSPGVTFRVDIPGNCDVFHASSALPYVADPLGVARAAFAAARHVVVLTRNSYSDRELYRVQRSSLFDNGSGPIPPGYANTKISYPHRTIREADIHALAAAAGFQCAFSCEEASGVVAYRNLVYGRQLAFERTSA